MRDERRDLGKTKKRETTSFRLCSRYTWLCVYLEVVLRLISLEIKYRGEEELYRLLYSFVEALPVFRRFECNFEQDLIIHYRTQNIRTV